MSVNDKCYALSNKATAIAVLTILAEGRGSPVATHWMNKVVPPARSHGIASHQPDTGRTRRFLHRLKGAGLVEGDVGRDGAIRWWKITQAGRDFLG